MIKKSAKVFAATIASAIVFASVTPSFAGQVLEQLPAQGDVTKQRSIKGGPQDALLSQGIIDQTTYDAIQAYMESKEDITAERINPMQTLLSNMLAEGVITQSEYEAILAAMPTRDNQTEENGTRPEPRQRIKGTPGEMSAESGERPEPGERPELGERSEPIERSADKGGDFFKNPFEAMVTNGVISQTTCDAMLAYMESQEASFIGWMKGNDMYAELLENGVITQTQYDAIRTALASRPKKPE